MEILILKAALLLLIFNIGLTLFRKLFGLRGSNTLNCGLVGFSGACTPNMATLKLLLLYNMSRGRDATGFVYDNNLFKSVDAADAFLTKHRGLLVQKKVAEQTTTFIGHTRGASVGIAKSERNAHPFKVCDYDTKAPRLYLAMNGTITNMVALNRKFEANYEIGDSDSLALSLMIWLYGYQENRLKEILNAYEGSANLLYYTHDEKNTLWVWKDPDRTLFYWPTSKGMYISSMDEALKAAGAEDSQIKTFEDYNLYKIVEGKIVSQEKLRETVAVYSNYEDAGYHERFPTKRTTGRGSVTTPFREAEKAPIKEYTSGNGLSTVKLRHENGLYYFGDTLFTGSGYFDGAGNGYSVAENARFKDYSHYSFFEGNLLKSEEAYRTLTAKLRDTTGNITAASVSRLLRVDLSKYTMYPLMLNPQHLVNNHTMVTWFHKGTRLEGEFVCVPYLETKKHIYKQYHPLEVEDIDDDAVETLADSVNGADNNLASLIEAYTAKHTVAYELYAEIAADFELKGTVQDYTDFANGLVDLGVESGVIKNKHGLGKLLDSNSITEDKNGVGLVSESLWEYLDTVLGSINSLDADNADPVDEDVALPSAEEEIQRKVITVAVYNPVYAAALDSGKFDTIEGLINEHTPEDTNTTVQERRLNTNNLSYLLAVRKGITRGEYLKLTDSTTSIHSIRTRLQNVYTEYLKR